MKTRDTSHPNYTFFLVRYIHLDERINEQTKREYDRSVDWIEKTRNDEYLPH